MAIYCIHCGTQLPDSARFCLNCGNSPRGDVSTQARILLHSYKCDKCGHEWLPRKQENGKEQPDPRVCPKCKSPFWNVPRKEQGPRKQKDSR